MKRHFVYGATALVLILGTVFWAYSARPPAQVEARPPLAVVAVDPTAGLDLIEPRTGDTFWGLHLDGVIPCSTMLVKGGGHLVILAPVDNPQSKCHFHVKDEKTVQLVGQTFRLKVIGDDQVRVERGEAALAVATQ